MFGTKVQGMHINWHHVASSETGDANTGTMQLDVTFNWYNNDVASQNSAVTTNDIVTWYLDIQNPIDVNYYKVLKDSIIGAFKATVTLGAPDTISLGFAVDDVTDCVAGGSPICSLADGFKDNGGAIKLDTEVSGTNDLVKLTAANAEICTEKW